MKIKNELYELLKKNILNVKDVFMSCEDYSNCYCSYVYSIASSVKYRDCSLWDRWYDAKQGQDITDNHLFTAIRKIMTEARY